MGTKPTSISYTKPVKRLNSDSFLNQMYQHVEKTVNSVHKAFSNSKVNDSIQKTVIKSPMSDMEFKIYMDNIGRIISPEEFKQSVFLGGLEPSLRKVGWRLLLNVYPVGLTGRERLNLLENKTKHYRSLKHAWKQKFKLGKLSDSEMAQIALVSVDVIRTDRALTFYSGEKNHQHVAQLFDILATYCMYHPSIGYYQGMSDLASPLLYVQSDEAVAYLCFCSLMRRVHCNFIPKPLCNENRNSESLGHNEQFGITVKLQHLYNLLHHIDRNFAIFLKEKHLGTLFFAHRWILLEMKREFSFQESLRLLEVQWASLPQSRFLSENSKDGVSLLEDELGDSIITGPLCPKHETNHLNKRPPKVRCYAVRDMTLICSLIGSQYSPSPPPQSVPQHLLLTDQGSSESDSNSESPLSIYSQTSQSFKYPENCLCVSDSKCEAVNGDLKVHQKHKSARNRNHSNFSDDERDSSWETSGGRNVSHSSASDASNTSGQHADPVVHLPPPDELGHGNPFLLFLCVSLLLEYRELILQGVKEASDILVLYQKLNQRHNISQVLNRARALFNQYLRDQEIIRRNLTEFPEIELSM